MEATAAASRATEWTFAQKGIVVLAVAMLAWSLAGFIAEPSFATGSDAPTEKVLGVDFNGWHAFSGLLLFTPAFFFALRPGWAVFYALYAGGALMLTSVWILLSTQPLFVLYLPNNESDAVFHFASGGAFLLVAGVQIRRDRAGA
jgi:hypothetical protein